MQPYYITVLIELYVLVVGNMSIGRREAYELFRRDYEHNDTIESNKRTLKQRCVEAKQLGELLAESRKKISTFAFFFQSTWKLWCFFCGTARWASTEVNSAV